MPHQPLTPTNDDAWILLLVSPLFVAYFLLTCGVLFRLFPFKLVVGVCTLYVVVYFHHLPMWRLPPTQVLPAAYLPPPLSAAVVFPPQLLDSASLVRTARCVNKKKRFTYIAID